ncbi:hypothetical protein FAIPA1_280059 [Frankia sp. AiPs1]
MVRRAERGLLRFRAPRFEVAPAGDGGPWYPLFRRTYKERKRQVRPLRRILSGPGQQWPDGQR